VASEGFGAIGINPIYLASQMVTFAVLLWILKKFLYKPIIKKLEQRAQKTKESLEKAEEIIKNKQAWEEKQEKLIQKSQIKTTEILAQAHQQAKKERGNLVKEAKAEAQTAAAGEYAKFEEKLKVQEKKLQQKTGKLIVEAARKILTESLDKKSQDGILKEQLEKLKMIKVK